jgi:hypothetical protein
VIDSLSCCHWSRYFVFNKRHFTRTFSPRTWRTCWLDMCVCLPSRCPISTNRGLNCLSQHPYWKTFWPAWTFPTVEFPAKIAFAFNHTISRNVFSL